MAEKNTGSILSSAKALGSINLAGAIGQISDVATVAQAAGSAIGGMVSAAAAVGSVVADVTNKALGLATDMSSAMGDFAAKTGVSKESLDGYQEILENIYSRNYGESFADISDAMATVKQSFGDLSDEQLQIMTESALTLRDTFGYDIAESMEAAQELMNKFGVSGEEAFNMIAKGSQDGLLASGEMLEGIAASHDSFALMAEDAASTAEAMNGIKEIQYDDMGSMLEEMGRTLEMFLLPLGEALLPILNQLFEAISPIFDVVLAILQPILDLIGSAITPLMEILSPLIDLIANGLTNHLGFLGELLTGDLKNAFNVITIMVDHAKEVFYSIAEFLQNVFSGDLEAAGESIKNIFRKLGDAVSEIIKQPLNWFIDKGNTLIRALNKIRFPDWFPIYPGEGLDISEIPRLKVGIDYVPSEFYPAYLDRGERVLTAEENARFTAAGGFAALESRGAYMMFDPSLIAAAVRLGLENANICVRGDVHTTLNADGKQLGEVVTPYVNQGLGALAVGKERGR